MPTITTANMNLTLPVVGQEPGPAYATEINNALTTIDSHNHSSGQGTQVTPSGLNINTDLTMGGFNLTNIRTTRFTAQSVLSGSASSDIGCVFVSGVDLYYNDLSGNTIQLTQNGTISAATGNIQNLTAPASAVYIPASAKVVFQSGSNTAASVDVRNVILRNASSGSKALTLSPPAGMGSDITETLPTIPGSNSFISMDTSGNMAADVSRNHGITSTSIGLGEVKRPNLEAVGELLSGTSGNFSTSNLTPTAVTNLNNTITTNGRAVMMGMQGDNSTSGFFYGINQNIGQDNTQAVYFMRDGVMLTSFSVIAVNATGVQTTHRSSPIWFLDNTAVAGSHSYEIRTSLTTSTAGAIARIAFAKLVLYEL